jgi:hypothetical protein
MGGALLKKWGLPEKRLSNDEYNRLKNELVNILHSQVHAFHRDVDYGDILRCYDTFGVAPAIKQKETHGDLDILVGVDSLEKDLGFNRRTYQDMLWDWRSERLNTSDFLERLSGHKPSVNSNVISFPYMGFQVDLTFVPLEDFYSSKNYNSWGDCSNLMGRVFHKMGLHGATMIISMRKLSSLKIWRISAKLAGLIILSGRRVSIQTKRYIDSSLNRNISKKNCLHSKI